MTGLENDHEGTMLARLRMRRLQREARISIPRVGVKTASRPQETSNPAAKGRNA
jgi:hypothetical protein